MCSNLKLLNNVPRKLIDDIIFSESVRISKRDQVLVVLTNRNQLFEVKNKEIISSINLQEQEDLVNSAIINETWPSMEVNDNNPQPEIVFRVFYSHTKAPPKTQIFFLVQANKKLWIIERIKSETSTFLRIIESIDSVEKFKIKDDNSSGRPLLEVYLLNSDVIRTRFNTEEDLDVQKSHCVSFNSIDQQNAELKSDLLLQKQFIQQKCFNLNSDLKFGPKLFRDNAEAATLVKYGDIWKRIHNDKLVIGIPILNTSFARRRTATNIKSSLICDDVHRFGYSQKLFKLRNDSYLFENFEELFDGDKLFRPKEDQSESEWMISNDSTLHPEQAAVILVTTELLNLPKFSFTIFVNYTINFEEIETELQIFMGSVDIDMKFLTDNDQHGIFVPHNKRNDTTQYKDLLTITSTSEVAFWSVVYNNDQKSRHTLSDFIAKHLNFEQILKPSDEVGGVEYMETDVEQNDHLKKFFYCDSGYFKNSLIILEESNELLTKLKVYVRIPNQLALIKDSILKDYKPSCSIKIDSNEDKYTLLRGIMDEIFINKTIIKNENGIINQLFMSKFAKEVQSDLIYNSIKS